MNTIEAAIKSIFSPVANPPVRGTFPLFQGANKTPLKAAVSDTFNGKTRFAGCADALEPNTHNLGRLDTFV